jgi:predicted alpha/beta-hydrolase family hydrolase
MTPSLHSHLALQQTVHLQPSANMPPKRRKTSEQASTPEPKRRVTRSSTRRNTRDAQELPNLPNDSSKPEPEASKEQSALNPKKPSPKTAQSEADAQPDQRSNSTTRNYTTLTITHVLVKKPIECHQYTPKLSPSNPSPTLIFTHGAGGTLSADAVVNFCTGFSSSLPILAFQGSMNLKARTKGFHACIDELTSNQVTTIRKKQEKKAEENRLLLGGRSMGARATIIAASAYIAERNDSKNGLNVQLVLISYPLQGPKQDLRDQILLDLPRSVSVLFVIGDRDAMCPLDLLKKTRSKMTATSQLVVVRGADHGMNVKPASATKEIGEETGRVAARWVGGRLEGDVMYIGEEHE